MKYKISLDRSVSKAIDKNLFSEEKLIRIIHTLLDWIEGNDVNLDIKKLKGKWQGFYRIRSGNNRLIIKVDFDHHTIHIERVGSRKRIY